MTEELVDSSYELWRWTQLQIVGQGQDRLCLTWNDQVNKTRTLPWISRQNIFELRQMLGIDLRLVQKEMNALGHFFRNLVDRHYLRRDDLDIFTIDIGSPHDKYRLIAFDQQMNIGIEV